MYVMIPRSAAVVCLVAAAYAQTPASIYALVVGRSGTEILDSPPESKKSVSRSEGRLVARRMTMPELARVLSGIVGRTVVDETGLPGEYDVTLTWTPDTGPKTAKERMDLGAAVENRSIFSAVREELGLDLVSRRAVSKDRAAKPGENQ